jgi:curved DNA-binding protein
MASDYYSILGVNKEASQDDIKKAFRRQAKKYHPDANPNDPKAEDRFKEINEAYETLGDPQKRQQYDMFGSNPRAGGFPGGFGGQNVNQEDLQDILSQFMNFGRSGSGRSRSVPQSEQSVSINLREAFTGSDRIMTYNGKQIPIKIPPGVDTGSKINVPGTPITLVIAIDADTQFRREGNDLYTDVLVDMFTALLGGEATVETLGRPLSLTIQAGTPAGKKLRLKGKGMPILNSTEKGDLYARVVITLPEKLTDEQRHAVEQLKKLF